jgi:hypothetical protein
MCDYLMGCKSTELDLLVFDGSRTFQMHLSVLLCAVTSVHKREQFIEAPEVSFYLWIAPYCATNVVHLPILVQSIN